MSDHHGHSHGGDGPPTKLDRITFVLVILLIIICAGMYTAHRLHLIR